MAEPGHILLSVDYSQIELRLAAEMAEIEPLKQAFRDGADIHAMTASQVFGVPIEGMDPMVRRQAKAINFGIVYGISAFGLANQLGIGQGEAGAYIKTYFERFPGIQAYMDATKAFVREHGYVETVFGRRLWLPEIRSSNGNRRQAAERAAINAPMQGTAADLIKLAMVAVQDWLEKSGLKSKLVLQVHDELLLEVPDEELMDVRTHLPRLMGQVAELKVPLVVEVGVGPNWEAAH